MTMQAKNGAIKTSAKSEPVFIHDNTTKPQMTIKTITAFVDHLSEWNTTGTVTPPAKLHRNHESHIIPFNFD